MVDVNLTGPFLCTAGGDPHHEGAEPQGHRPHHQQRLDLGLRAALLGAVRTATKRHHGLTRSTALDCRRYNIACGQIDIGNAATEMTERMAAGVIQADGSMKVEPRMT